MLFWVTFVVNPLFGGVASDTITFFFFFLKFGLFYSDPMLSRSRVVNIHLNVTQRSSWSIVTMSSILQIKSWLVNKILRVKNLQFYDFKSGNWNETKIKNQISTEKIAEDILKYRKKAFLIFCLRREMLFVDLNICRNEIFSSLI